MKMFSLVKEEDSALGGKGKKAWGSGLRGWKMGALFSAEPGGKKAQHRDLFMNVCVVPIIVRKLQRIGRFRRGWRKSRLDLGQLSLILCFLSVSLLLLFSVTVFID